VLPVWNTSATGSCGCFVSASSAHLALVFEKAYDCVRNDSLRTQCMTQDDMTFLALRMTRVGAGDKRSFDPVDKRRLIDACLEPGHRCLARPGRLG
jgi:hypothetical protein